MQQRERDLAQDEVEALVEGFARAFVGRWDLHARQLDDGRYICIRNPLAVEHLAAHLSGDVTLGIYVLDQASRARFVVLDADDERGWRQLVAVSKRLAADDVPSYLETSRRGGHLWFFFAQPISGRDARAFGRGIIAIHRIDGVELFPKQSRLRKGPGSLIRLPFGVHRRDGHRYGFVKPDGAPLAPTLRGQIQLLAAPAVVSEAGFEAYQSVASNPLPRRRPSLPEPSTKPVSEALEWATDAVSERIKATVSVREFVGRYVELSATGIGLCPFHDDHHPSFAVNDEENYWHCFACGVGGSVIDFFMRWRECDFTTAVRELARELP